jgi:hypothetical protein
VGNEHICGVSTPLIDMIFHLVEGIRHVCTRLGVTLILTYIFIGP